MNQFVYFDHNATTPITAGVANMISNTLVVGGNASSIHTAGRLARQKVEEARDKIAKLVGARASEVVFTSGGTEANNLVLCGIQCEHIMVSAVEHDSVLGAAANIGHLTVDENGKIDMEAFERRLDKTDGQVLVSIMLANNETGVIQPVAEVSKIAKKYGALVHTDAIQACGKIKFDKLALGVDFISLSAHKIGGPQGVGALIISEDVPLNSLMRGGGQERGRRAGTENISGIAGFGVAGEFAQSFAQVAKIRKLRDALESSIKRIVPGIIIFGENVDRLPNTSCIFMPGVSSETQVMKFDLKGIMVSAGSACSSGKVQPSHVLRAMGVDNGIASNTIRISLGNENTMDDVDYFVREWKKIYMSAHANKFMEVA
jgi:cysteine desulfurase